MVLASVANPHDPLANSESLTSKTVGKVSSAGPKVVSVGSFYLVCRLNLTVMFLLVNPI